MQPKVYKRASLALMKFLQYFKRWRCTKHAYIFQVTFVFVHLINRGADASKAHHLKKALHFATKTGTRKITLYKYV